MGMWQPVSDFFINLLRFGVLANSSSVLYLLGIPPTTSRTMRIFYDLLEFFKLDIKRCIYTYYILILIPSNPGTIFLGK